jgi:hypothetical protein
LPDIAAVRDHRGVFGRVLSIPEILTTAVAIRPLLAARLNYYLIENREAGKDLQGSIGSTAHQTASSCACG